MPPDTNPEPEEQLDAATVEFLAIVRRERAQMKRWVATEAAFTYIEEAMKGVRM